MAAGGEKRFIADGVSDSIVIVDHSPGWASQFERLSERAAAAVGDLVCRIEHIGSTAVPGLAAKPVIDLVVVIPADENLPEVTRRLSTIGYEAEGDLGVSGREAFRWPAGEERHHLYVSTQDSAHLASQLTFRDALRSDRQLARDYEELKRRLAKEYVNDRAGYSEAKTDFIRAAVRSAAGDERSG